MKTSHLLLSGIFVSVMFACSHQVEKSSSPEPSEPIQPKSLITIQKAKEQLDNFKTAHPGVNADQYALRTWISIEELENYIAFVKEESRKKKIEVNGIDLIYTQYKAGKPGQANQGNADYELTLMYAPTYKEGTHNTAFDPVNSTEGKPAKLSELLGSTTPTDSTSEKAGGSGAPRPTPSGIGNNINSCPNVCP